MTASIDFSPFKGVCSPAFMIWTMTPRPGAARSIFDADDAADTSRTSLPIAPHPCAVLICIPFGLPARSTETVLLGLDVEIREQYKAPEKVPSVLLAPICRAANFAVRV